MPAYCCVKSCPVKSSDKSVSLFKFPTVDKRSEKCTRLSTKRRLCWMVALGLQNLEKCDNLRICERHFISGIKSELMDENNPDWVPSQNLQEEDHFYELLPDVSANETNDTKDFFEHQEYDEVDESFNVDMIHHTVGTQTDASITGASTTVFLSYEQKIRLLEEELIKYQIKTENFQNDYADT